MATPNGIETVGDLGRKDELLFESVEESSTISSRDPQPAQVERKAQIDAIWEEMNRGISSKKPKCFTRKCTSNVNKAPLKTSHGWMTYLGMAPKKADSNGHAHPQKEPCVLQNGTSDETRRLAAAALLNVKEAASAVSVGRVEVSEVRDFAGEEIEVRKLVDAESEEALEKAKSSASTSAVDAILEQIKKKPKLSVLDKTKKDWGEFKGENKGMEDELDAYKKSSNQYLDKVSFLQRTDYREFERERDVRLALQSRRRPDNMQDGT